MLDATLETGAATKSHGSRSTRALEMRIRGEYLEMPGMSLTVQQAARLFNLEVTLCAQVLEALVKNGVLWTNGREFFRGNVSQRFA